MNNNMFRVKANGLARQVTVGETVHLGITGCVSSITADLVDVGHGRVMPGETFVTICVEQVWKVRHDRVADEGEETA